MYVLPQPRGLFGRAASPIMFIISAFSCTNAADAQCEPCGNLPAPRCSKARPGKPSTYMDTVTATTSSLSVKPKLVSTCREGSHLGGRTKIRPSSDPQVGERQGTDLLVPYHPLTYNNVQIDCTRFLSYRYTRKRPHDISLFNVVFL